MNYRTTKHKFNLAKKVFLSEIVKSVDFIKIIYKKVKTFKITLMQKQALYF